MANKARTGRYWIAAAWVGASLCLGLPARAEEEALPPLARRDVGTMQVHKPKDLLLPGETLRRRWATGEDTVYSGPTARSATPATRKKPGRVAVLPPPPQALRRPPPVPWAAARPLPAPPAQPVGRRSPARQPVLNLQTGCSGQFQLDGIAVDAMGRPCFGGG